MLSDSYTVLLIYIYKFTMQGILENTIVNGITVFSTKAVARLCLYFWGADMQIYNLIMLIYFNHLRFKLIGSLCFR